MRGAIRSEVARLGSMDRAGKLRGQGEEEKARAYIFAEAEYLQERLARVIGGEKEIEVVMNGPTAERDGKKNGKAIAKNSNEILVLVSSGAVLEDLQRIHSWRSAAPGIKVIVMGGSHKEPDFLQYVRSGVAGFLRGDATASEVVNGVRTVLNGESVCGASQCAILFRYFAQEAESFPSAALQRDLGLTRREQQLIPLLTRGLTNKEIANHFSLAEQTVKNHLYRMKRKIGAHGRLEIVDVCRQHGFLA